MADHSRVLNKFLQNKIMPAEEAASLIPNGATVGMSGFTGAGYPKAVPTVLAKLALDERLRGKPYRLNVLTGASTGPEQDTMMSVTESQQFRFPYQGDAATREKINAGLIEYQDMHLSHVGSLVRYGYYGKVDFAVIEVTKIREDGSLIYSSSVGGNNVYLEHAEKIILEVNSWQDERLEGMHDIFSVSSRHGERVAIPITRADDRVGKPYQTIDLSKVVAVIETHCADRNAPFKAPEEVHKKIAQHILDFLDGEVKAGRLPKSLTPLQSGVGNIANAVLVGLGEGVVGLARRPGALQQEHRALPQADHPAPPGDLQPPRGHPPPRLHRHERLRRGRHLRPHQLDAHRGQGHRERHRRVGARCP